MVHCFLLIEFAWPLIYAPIAGLPYYVTDRLL
jgi:hypothetical protein